MAATDERTEQLEAARAAAVAVLAGRSPRQRGTEKMHRALDWVYRWGWSSPSTIEQVGGAVRSGLAARLVKRGLLRSTRTESGGAQRGVPAFILTLTEPGQAEIERVRDTLLPYDRDPYRVRQDQLRHYQLAQTATLKALQDGSIKSFQTERELIAKSTKGVKQPDVIWTTAGGEIIAVEVELTAKWSRDLDGFVRGCINALTPLGNDAPRFSRIAVVSDSPAIVKNYRAAFAPGATCKAWSKDNRGHWTVDKDREMQVPEAAARRMLWRTISD